MASTASAYFIVCVVKDSFFFSSRRRHTRFDCDWSSDVCSSDLVTYVDLMKILEKDAVEIEKGDMLCLYTGFADVILELKKNPDPKLLHGTCSGLDGRDERLLQWISDSGLACLIADNYAVEIIPTSLTRPKPHASMPLHEHSFLKTGIQPGGLWYPPALAPGQRKHAPNRFLPPAPPLLLPGAVGSPATPIATV